MAISSSTENGLSIYQTPNEPTTKNSLTSTISNFCSSILTPEESPNWKTATFKVCLGAASRAAIEFYRISDFGGYGSYMNLAGECLSTGLTLTGVREIGYLAYTRLAYKPAETRNLKVGTRGLQRKHIKVATLAEKNAQLAKLIKVIKLITITGMSLHCLYNYDYLGNFHLFNENYSFAHHANLYSLSSLPYVTSVELQLAQMAACAFSVFMNCKQLRAIKNEEEFLKDNPISEIVNAIACASFFSQLNAVSTEAQNWYQCMLPNVRSCFQRRLKDPSKSCQHDLYEKCMSLLPPGQVGAKMAKKYLQSIKNYWLMELHNLGEREAAVKIGHLQLRHLQSWTKEYGLIIPLKNTFSLIKKNAQECWNQQPFITKINKEPEVDLRAESEERPVVKKEKFIPREEQAEVEIIEYSSNKSDKKQIDEKPVKKAKVKTRGVPNKNKSQKTIVKEPVNEKSKKEQFLDPRKLERVKALRKIQLLRCPTKEKRIEKLLGRAAAFVGGKIVGNQGKGTLHSLVWDTGKSIITLNYETPHEFDRNNYSGNKYDRVVNVLRAAYLIGLDDAVADKYIEKYKMSRIYRIIKYVGFIFSNNAQV